MGRTTDRREGSAGSARIHERAHGSRGVRADAVDAPIEEPIGDLYVIHRPCGHATALLVHEAKERLVDELPVLPEVTRERVTHRANRVHRVARLENTGGDVWRDLGDAPGNAMVEAVDGTPAGRCVNGGYHVVLNA